MLFRSVESRLVVRGVGGICRRLRQSAGFSDGGEDASEAKLTETGSLVAVSSLVMLSRGCWWRGALTEFGVVFEGECQYRGKISLKSTYRRLVAHDGVGRV